MKKLLFLLLFITFTLTGCEILGDTDNNATVSFDSNGGTEVASVTIAMGELLTEPVQPTKEGYIFGGWFLDINFETPFDFSGPIEEDLMLYGKWEGVPFTVTFYDYDNSIIEEIDVPYNDEINLPNPPERTGFTFIGWDLEIPSLMPMEDLRFNAQYEINTYTVTIHDADGNMLTHQEFTYGSSIELDLENILPYGYEIVDFEETLPDTMPAEDITLTAIVEDVLWYLGPIIAYWPFSEESELDDWREFEGPTGIYSIDVSLEEGAMRVDINATNNTWEPRLDTQNIPFEYGYEYTICFDAKASLDGKSINIQIGELFDYDPWFDTFISGIHIQYTLTEYWETYCFSFFMLENNPRGGILFEFGDIPNYQTQFHGLLGTIWLDNVVVRGGPIVASNFDPLPNNIGTQFYVLNNFVYIDDETSTKMTNQFLV